MEAIYKGLLRMYYKLIVVMPPSLEFTNTHYCLGGQSVGKLANFVLPVTQCLSYRPTHYTSPSLATTSETNKF